MVANTRRPEFDRPTAADAGQSTYHYPGSSGIACRTLFRRAAFATPPGLTAAAGLEGVHERVADHPSPRRPRPATDLAPFIRWDPQPAALVVGGRIVFLAAGYTVSDSYPYAQRTDIAGSNASYARLAVQATVDAYSGRVRLYAVDQADPILRAWTAAFPGMFEPISRMPRGIRERLRYPAGLVRRAGRALPAIPHDRRRAFASGADAWSMPTSLSGPDRGGR